jgi:lysyl-tRNA synthetase class 2
MSDELSTLLQARRAKLDALNEKGILPFAYSFDRTHTAAAALTTFPSDGAEEGPAVRVAGRLVAWRGHGKTAFAHVADESGRIQLYFKKDQLAEVWSMVELLDIGDYVGVSGPVFKTRTGELTVRVEQAELLSKSLRPLPFGKEETVDGAVVRHSGFSDTEQRVRQRYADLAVHPEVRAFFRARSAMIREIRTALDELGYLEVETPVLQPLYGGAAARPFVTTHNTLDMQLYLRIADELYLKRLVVGGFERVYEIGHDFRNEGIDRTHNPEFTMLEFYEAFADYTTMMGRVEQLIVRAANAVAKVLDNVAPGVVDRSGEVPKLSPPFPRIEWVPTLNKALGANILEMGDVELRNAAKKANVAKVDTLSRPKLMDELFQHHVESKIDAPTFVLDYPKELSPLAKPKRGGPAGITERFELFAKGKEMANAFSELNDPIDQRQRLEAQAGLRAAGDLEASGVDEDYLRAMKYGMPPMGGVGIGMDRLFMYLTGTPNIRDVILFPTLRPEAD